MCIYLQVNSKEEAISENLHALCCAHDVPICIVRGLADVLDLNLELFSSDSLTKTYGEQEIEVRIQVSSSIHVLDTSAVFVYVTM